MSKDISIKDKLVNYLKNLDYYVAVVCMLFVAVFCFVNVITRYFFGKTSAALDELNMIVFIWFLYASITYCVRLDRHIRVEVLGLYMSKRKSAILKTIADSIWFVFSIYITYAAFKLVKFNLLYIARTPMLEIPMFIVYLILLLSFALMSLLLLKNIINRIKEIKTLGERDI